MLGQDDESILVCKKITMMNAKKTMVNSKTELKVKLQLQHCLPWDDGKIIQMSNMSDVLYNDPWNLKNHSLQQYDYITALIRLHETFCKNKKQIWWIL